MPTVLLPTILLAIYTGGMNRGLRKAGSNWVDGATVSSTERPNSKRCESAFVTGIIPF